jgi:hypothetical protein
MGLLNSLSKLLDESSDESLEKKLTAGLDRIEQTLGATVDKFEEGVRSVDKAASKVNDVGRVIESADKKISEVVRQRDSV